MAFADEHNLDLWRGYGSILNGYALVLDDQVERSVAVMEVGLKHLARTQTGAVAVHYDVHAYALARLGRLEDAARYAALVREEQPALGLRALFLARLLRWLGDYMALLPEPRPGCGRDRLECRRSRARAGAARARLGTVALRPGSRSSGSGRASGRGRSTCSHRCTRVSTKA